MKKNKDGKVVASLTEVKNKTGDIFAVVDEYGEIILTSYNKPRYKVVKIDLAESLEIEGHSDSKKSSKKNKKVEKKEEAEISVMEPKPVEPTITSVVSTSVTPMNIPEPNVTESKKELEKKTGETKQRGVEEQVENEIVPWNSNNENEKLYISKILNPLQ